MEKMRMILFLSKLPIEVFQRSQYPEIQAHISPLLEERNVFRNRKNDLTKHYSTQMKLSNKLKHNIFFDKLIFFFIYFFLIFTSILF